VEAEESAECSPGIFSKASYNATTGEIKLVIDNLTLEVLADLGLDIGRDRPAKVDLFDTSSSVTRVDFFDYSLAALIGGRLEIDLTPFTVAGMFEKMAGTLKITDAE